MNIGKVSLIFLAQLLSSHCIYCLTCYSHIAKSHCILCIICACAAWLVRKRCTRGVAHRFAAQPEPSIVHSHLTEISGNHSTIFLHFFRLLCIMQVCHIVLINLRCVSGVLSFFFFTNGLALEWVFFLLISFFFFTFSNIDNTLFLLNMVMFYVQQSSSNGWHLIHKSRWAHEYDLIVQTRGSKKKKKKHCIFQQSELFCCFNAATRFDCIISHPSFELE